MYISCFVKKNMIQSNKSNMVIEGPHSLTSAWSRGDRTSATILVASMRIFFLI